jgi:hypothetical protein
VTVARPRDSARSGSIALPPAGALDLAHVIELAGFEARIPGTADAIGLSAQASMLLRAGLAVHAFVIDALMHADRTLALGGRTVVLEVGVYRSLRR